MIGGTWTVTRALVVAAAALNLACGALVYTPPLDVVVLVFVGPGVLLGAALALRAWAWLEVAAGILLALPALLVLFLFGEIAWLADPFRGTFGDYLSIVLLAVSLLLTVPALLARVPRLRLAPRALRTYAVGVALVALGASASTAAIVETSQPSVGGFDVTPDARVEVRLVDGAFEPRDVRVAAGVLTEIVLVNEDDMWHTLSYAKDGDVRHHRVLPLSSARVLVRFDAPMELEMWCEPHASGMRGTLVVEPRA